MSALALDVALAAVADCVVVVLALVVVDAVAPASTLAVEVVEDAGAVDATADVDVLVGAE